MPEGHTIHRIARDHRRDYCGHKLRVSSPQGRFAESATSLDGKRLKEIDAYGKHLFYDWQGNHTVHIHLGLYGKFRRHKLPLPEPRGAVRLRVAGPKCGFDLNGPNRCELVDQTQKAKIIERLGADPLRKDADVTRALNRLGKSRAPIGALLLNQSVIAGVGNVYRAEALFALGIDPRRPGNSLDKDSLESLWNTLVEMLKIGEKYNKIITADPKTIGKPLSRMNRQERVMIYKAPACPRCDNEVSSWELAARRMYACLRCQM